MSLSLILAQVTSGVNRSRVVQPRCLLLIDRTYTLRYGAGDNLCGPSWPPIVDTRRSETALHIGPLLGNALRPETPSRHRTRTLLCGTHDEHGRARRY